jgi:hypothetical protein
MSDLSICKILLWVWSVIVTLCIVVFKIKFWTCVDRTFRGLVAFVPWLNRGTSKAAFVYFIPWSEVSFLCLSHVRRSSVVSCCVVLCCVMFCCVALLCVVSSCNRTWCIQLYLFVCSRSVKPLLRKVDLLFLFLSLFRHLARLKAWGRLRGATGSRNLNLMSNF